jgi:hypothetical protein
MLFYRVEVGMVGKAEAAGMTSKIEGLFPDEADKPPCRYGHE